METACGYLTEDKGVAWFSSDEYKWRNRMTKLAEQYPDDVKITVRAEENDGCINALFPAKWLKIGPPRKLNYTDEQKQAIAERLQKAREAQSQYEDEMEEEEDE